MFAATCPHPLLLPPFVTVVRSVPDQTDLTGGVGNSVGQSESTCPAADQWEARKVKYPTGLPAKRMRCACVGGYTQALHPWKRRQQVSTVFTKGIFKTGKNNCFGQVIFKKVCMGIVLKRKSNPEGSFHYNWGCM